MLRNAACEPAARAVDVLAVIADGGFDTVEGCELATVAAFKPTVTTPGIVVVVVPDEAAVDGRMIRRGVWICAAALGAEAGAFAFLYDACVVVWNGGCIRRGSTDRISTTHLWRPLVYTARYLATCVALLGRRICLYWVRKGLARIVRKRSIRNRVGGHPGIQTATMATAQTVRTTKAKLRGR